MKFFNRPWPAVLSLAFLTACNANWDMENIRDLPASKPLHHQDAVAYTGKTTEAVVVNLALLKKGKEFFEIHCRLCHGTTGLGDGHIPQHGFPYNPPSYHSAQARQLNVADIMTVAKNGKGIMLGFGDRLQDSTLFAIANYVKVLQLSRHFPIDQLTAAERQRLERPAQ